MDWDEFNGWLGASVWRRDVEYLSLRWVNPAVWNEVWHGVASDVVTPYDDGLVWEESYGLG